jgi:hypothetical protein
VKRYALLIVAMTAAAAGGCGGKHRPGPSFRARHPAYAWLVRTAGPQPTIVAENRAPGTTAWRLPGPRADTGGRAHGNLNGYVARQSISPGQTERIYVSAPGARFVHIHIFRIGWYGGTGGRQVLASARLALVRQPPCAHGLKTGLTTCAWHPTLSFRIPPGLGSGVYIAKLSTVTGESDCLFVVRSTRPRLLLAQLPTATYEAYNAWGGDSLYPGGADRVRRTGTTQGVAVSDQRPYDSVTGAGQFFSRDVALVRFLERYGYSVSYTTSESVDADPGQLAGHRALVDFGHSEYWSERQREGFSRALARGTSLLFLSSDTLAWRVRYRGGHIMVGYKEYATLDRDRAAPTGRFPDRGAGLTGSAYKGCITPRLDQPGPPAYRYYTWAPSPSLAPAWLFARTGISAGTRIPGIVGYELDRRTAETPPRTMTVGGGTAPCMPSGAPEPGDPVPGPGDDLAETTLYTSPSGAIVFSTGTLGWTLGLEPVPSASPDAPRAPDRRLVALTRNLLAHVLQR